MLLNNKLRITLSIILIAVFLLTLLFFFDELGGVTDIDSSITPDFFKLASPRSLYQLNWVQGYYLSLFSLSAFLFNLLILAILVISLCKNKSITISSILLLVALTVWAILHSSPFLKNNEFIEAMAQNNYTLIEEKIDNFKDKKEINNEIRMQGFQTTPLNWAVIFGNNKLVSMLLEKGADINLKDGSEKTPIMYACTKYWLKRSVMKTLLEKGASTIWPDGEESYRDIITYSIYNEVPSKYIRYILDTSKKREALLKPLKTKLKTTKLIYSVTSGKVAYCEIFLDYQPSTIVEKDALGNSALDYAKQYQAENTSLIEYLERKEHEWKKRPTDEI